MYEKKNLASHFFQLSLSHNHHMGRLISIKKQNGLTFFIILSLSNLWFEFYKNDEKNQKNCHFCFNLVDCESYSVTNLF